MGISALLSVVAVMAVSTPSVPDDCPAGWQPTPNNVSQVEASLRLPGRYQLPSYDRYYAGACVDGRRTIRGVFVLAREPLAAQAPTFHIVKESELPLIMDGGCSIIDFTVVAADLTKASAVCHGYG